MKLCLVLYAMKKFLKLQMMACANEIIADMKNYPNIQGEQTVPISLILTLRSLVACSPYPQSGKLVISTALVSTPCFLTHSRNSGIAFSLSSGGQLRPGKMNNNTFNKQFWISVIFCCIKCYTKNIFLSWHHQLLSQTIILLIPLRILEENDEFDLLREFKINIFTSAL